MADTLSELIPILRVKLGDINPASYRYIDSWLLTSLQASVVALARYWSSKYLLDASSEIYRNTLSSMYSYEETTTPVIQDKDVWIIVLMASVILKSGTLENMAWNIGSWRDAELSYSNIESGKQKDESLKRDIAELDSYLKKPIKRPVSVVRTAFTELT